MAVNQKAVKVLNKVLEAGFTDEKAIAAMTMDDILSIPNGFYVLFVGTKPETKSEKTQF